MASLINAIRNIEGDRFWFIKGFVLSLPLIMIMGNEAFLNNSFNNQLIILGIILVIYNGVSSILIHRNINNESPILPGIFSIFDILLHAVLSSIVMFPGLVIIAVLISSLYGLQMQEELYRYIAYSIVIIIGIPFSIVPMVLYSANYKFQDALKINLIFRAAGNFSVSFISFLIQYVIIFLIASYVIYLVIKTMVGEENVILYTFIAFVITMSYLVFMSFCSDLYGDVIPPLKSKRHIL